MYEAFFGLRDRPFVSVPRVDQYYPAGAIEAARQTLTRCIERAEGAGIIIGPSGTGKTLLCQILANELSAGRKTVFLASAQLSTRRMLLQAILHGLGQPYRGMDEGELRLTLIDYLSSKETCPAGMVLLVDEAHAIPLRLFEELRALTSLAREGQPQLRLVLAGGPDLEEHLASPKLDSFSQRIVARCYLQPLNRTETEQYVRSQINRAGAQGREIFSADACQAVYRATDGVPRLVNQVCDHALILAHGAGKRSIDPAIVEEAWADLQQLPTPWTSSEKERKQDVAVVEFGGLVDEPETDLATPTEKPEVEFREEPTPSLRMAPLPDVETLTTFDESQSLDDLESTICEVHDEFLPAGSIQPAAQFVFDDPSSPFSESFEQEEIVVDRYQSIAPSSAIESPILPCSAELPSPPAAASQASLRETVPLLRATNLDVTKADDTEIVVEETYDTEEARAIHRIAPVRRREYRQLFARLRSVS